MELSYKLRFVIISQCSKFSILRYLFNNLTTSKEVFDQHKTNNLSIFLKYRAFDKKKKKK